jgi:hypothetical protein
MSTNLERGVDKTPDYVYRRDLAFRELLPAIGVAIGAAAAAFYVARILLQRTPLVPVHDIPTVGPPPTITRRPARAFRRADPG